MRVDVKTHFEFNSDKKMKLIGYDDKSEHMLNEKKKTTKASIHKEFALRWNPISIC